MAIMGEAPPSLWERFFPKRVDVLCNFSTYQYYRIHRPSKYYEIAFHPHMLQRKVRDYFTQRYARKIQFLR